MNRTLTIEIRDIPEEVWEFLINDKGSEEAVDNLIKEMLTDKATVALVAYYELMQAKKAGIPLESLAPKVIAAIVGDTLEPGNTKDKVMLETEKHVTKLIDKIKEKGE